MLKPEKFIIQIQNEIESRHVQEILFKLECYWIDQIRPNFQDKHMKYILVVGHIIRFIEHDRFDDYQDILMVNFEQLATMM